MNAPSTQLEQQLRRAAATFFGRLGTITGASLSTSRTTLGVHVIRRQNMRGQVRITFVLTDNAAPGAVSVVGNFNGWTPGANPLVRRRNGTRSAVVSVPAGTELRFRYLGEGGRWFDDETADEYNHDGCLVRA